MKAQASGRGGLWADQDGVSDVVGSILLVAITVVMAAALGALLFSFEGPRDTQHTQLAFILDPGADGKWQGEGGDIDSEQVRILHLGGEPLLANSVSGTLVVANVTSTLAGATLAASSATGPELSIGETWRQNVSLARNDIATLSLVTRLSGGGGQVVSSARGVAGSQVASTLCAADSTAPLATLPLGQAPADVSNATSGPVTVTAILSDNCSGINTSSPPELWYCVAVTCPFPSAFTSGGAMVLNGSVWSGTIPHGSWGPDLGKNLTYRIVNMTDLAGNRANSTSQVDYVNVFAQYTYVGAAVATNGTVANLGYAQDATNALEATFSEGASGGASSGSMALLGQTTGIATTGTGWLTTTNAVGADDLYATNVNDARTITVPLTDPATTSGVITQVSVHAEVSIAGANNDQWTLYACLSGTCNAGSTVVGGAVDHTISYDATSARPGGGSWSWSDIPNLQVRLGTVRSGGIDGTWRIDNVSATVVYQATYLMNIQANFTGVPGGTQAVEVRHRNATGETFLVEACTAFSGSCTTWTALGALPAASSPTVTAFNLPSGAYLSGSPKVRFVDANPGGTTQGALLLDYVRIATT